MATQVISATVIMTGTASPSLTQTFVLSDTVNPNLTPTSIISETATPSLTPTGFITATPAPITSPTLEFTVTPAQTSTPEPTTTLTSTPTATPQITPTPLIPATVTSVKEATLILSTDRMKIRPGGLLTIHWQMKNLSENIEGLELTFQVPAGFSPYGLFDDQEITDIPSTPAVIQTTPAITASITGTLTIPNITPTPDFQYFGDKDGSFNPNTHTLSLKPKAHAGNLVWWVSDGAEGPFQFQITLSNKGDIMAEQILTIDEEGLTSIPVEGGTASGINGKVKVVFPANSAPEALAVRIHTPGQNFSAPYSASGNPFEILARGRSSANNLHQFSQPLTIQVSYSFSETQSLSVVYYDEQIREWIPLPTRMDYEN